MKPTTFSSFLIVLSVALGLHRSGIAAGDPAAGQQKFKACAECHGPVPTTPLQEAVPKLRGQHAEYVVSALEDYAGGARTHAAMSKIAAALTLQDKEDIAAYIARFELTKFPIPSGDQPTPLERKLEVCRSCHGERGNNFTPDTPRLIGQDERYLRKALIEYRNGTRKNLSMAYVLRNLSDQDVAEMAAYYAGQQEGLTALE